MSRARPVDEAAKAKPGINMKMLAFADYSLETSGYWESVMEHRRPTFTA